ncbi:MAG: glycoside hydrolase family 6 protein [Janthinobacterium lividum]
MTACSAGDGVEGTPRDGATPSPVPTSALAGTRLWTNPQGHAVDASRQFSADGQTNLVTALEPLADQPVATWLTGSDADPFAVSRDLTTAAAAEGRTATLVLYNLPGRDCGQFSSGGASDPDAYLSWVGALAAGIGDRPAVVILEPDAVPHAIQGCAGTSADDRYRMLSTAVDILVRQPGVKLYIDAGNASWIKDLTQLASGLRAGGITKTAGFALNVSNFETTQASAAYGSRLSDLLDGAHFVIDTSRNGAGAPPGAGTGQTSSWCNPQGVRLGETPTTQPRLDRVDALLWVKQPGDSDGDCNPGDPPAGTFDLRYAAELLGTTLP